MLRLYFKAIFTGFRRNKVWTLNNQVLPNLEGINDKKETQYYLGKRVLFFINQNQVFKLLDLSNLLLEYVDPYFTTMLVAKIGVEYGTQNKKINVNRININLQKWETVGHDF